MVHRGTKQGLRDTGKDEISGVHPLQISFFMTSRAQEAAIYGCARAINAPSIDKTAPFVSYGI